MNLGFERRFGRTDIPVSWVRSGAGYTIELDTEEHAAGSRSLRIERVADLDSSGMAWQSLPIFAVAGRTITLSGAIRTEGISAFGHAGLWMQVTGRDGVVGYDDMRDQGPSGTTDWKRYTLDMAVDPCATQVVVGVLNTGDGKAWFDDLKIQVVGDAPRDPAAHCGTPEPKEWIAWTTSHARPITSLSSPDFTDLHFLAPLLEGKRVVQLGESAHGVAEFDLLKVRLVKYLHEELGYDVIAFESSLYECFQAYRRVRRISAKMLMDRCTFQVWQTREVLPLFEYIKETAATDHPLILAGFDTQVSSPQFVRGRPRVFESLLSPVDPTIAKQIASIDESLLSWVTNLSGMDTLRADAELANGFITNYQNLVRYFDAHEDRIIAGARYDTALVWVARRTAWSMTRLVEQLHYGRSPEGTVARDSGMALNLDFLLDSLYPDRKIITWGHNFHLRYANQKVTPNPVRTMGSWVADRRRSEVYTIGLYMHHGHAATNSHQPYAIEAPWPGDVESILAHAPGNVVFLDISRAVPEAANEWLFRPMHIRSWGTESLVLTPAEQYDALVLVRSVQPPEYR